MLLEQIFLIYLLFFHALIFCKASCNFVLFHFINLFVFSEWCLINIKAYQILSPIFISRYTSYIFELNLNISIALNIMNNYFVTFFECRLDQILGRQGSKAKDVYESKLSLASRIVKTERQVIIPI